MDSKLSLRRLALGLCVAAGLGFGGLVHAGDTLTEETRVDVRTKAGPVETVIVNEMKLGETRSISTASGNPALITRTATGMKLEVAGESFDIALPDPGSDAEAALGPDAKIVKIEKHVDEKSTSAGGNEKKVVIIKDRAHGAEGHEVDADALAANAMVPGPLPDGKRIRVIRQIRHETTANAAAH